MKMSFDAKAAYEHVKNLSFPRATGSQGEKRSVEYISGLFKQLGLDIKIQSFVFSYLPSRLFLRLGLLLQSGIILAASGIFDKAPIVSVLLILLLNVLLVKASRWGRFQERLYNIKKTGFSKNIIARKKAEDADIVLIFLAHYDTKSQTMPIWLRFFLYCIGFFGSWLIGLVIVILTIVELNGMTNIGWLLAIRHSLLPFSVVLAGILLSLQFNFSGNKSPGALDNASGVGVLLELARSLSENPPEKVDLVFVATGAEEDGLVGAMRYMQKYSQDFDPKRSFFINYDGAGAEGKITITTKYGIPPTIASRKLSELAIKIASQKGIKASEGYVPIGAGFDQFPIAARGFEAVTISSGNFGPVIFSIHSSYDCLKNVSLEALQNAGSIGFELAKQIRCLRWQNGKTARGYKSK
jgi:hypothetical protein